MRSSLLLSVFSFSAIAFGAEEYTARKLYQLPEDGPKPNNLLPRGESGYLLLTQAGPSQLTQFDTFHQHGGPTLVIDLFQQQTVGITELSPDLYAVSTWARDGGETVPVMSIYTVDLTGPSPTATILSDDAFVSVAGPLKGLAAVGSNFAFQAEIKGFLHAIDFNAGTARQTSSTAIPGISGLGYREPYLYYTNSYEGTFGRVEVDAMTGQLAGEFETLVQSDLLVGAEDFALSDSNEDAFVANAKQNTLVRVRLGAKTAGVVVTTITAPLSARFASWGGLFVVANGTETEGSSIWSVVVPDQPQN